ELTARGEDRVADRLGLEPARRESPEPAVLTIGLESARVGPARLPVGGRPHDQPMDWLELKTTADVLAREPVEERGVRRGTAVEAEVARRGHQPSTEVIVPDAVDHHPCRQRVEGIAEPAG